MDQAIAMTLPNDPRYQSLARLAIASFAAIHNLDVEAIEDLRVCLSEGLNMFLESASSVDVYMQFDQDKLEVQISSDDEEWVKGPGYDMGRMILDSLMDEVCFDTNRIIFIKDAGEVYHDRA